MRTDVLRQVDVFRGLDEPALERLAQEFVEIRVPESYPLFREGTPADAFYVVCEGRVSVYRDAVGQPVRLLGRVEPGEYFGELDLFTEEESSFSARTAAVSRLLKIEKQTFLDFLEDHPAVALKLQMAAAKRHTVNAAAALELGGRTEVRIRIHRHVALVLDDGTTHSAILDNLSFGGLSLQGAPVAWKVDDRVDFGLRFGDEVLDCEGRVAWVQGDLLGLAFTHRSKDHETRVQHSMRRLLRLAAPGD